MTITTMATALIDAMRTRFCDAKRLVPLGPTRAIVSVLARKAERLRVGVVIAIKFKSSRVRCEVHDLEGGHITETQDPDEAINAIPIDCNVSVEVTLRFHKGRRHDRVRVTRAIEATEELLGDNLPSHVKWTVA